MSAGATALLLGFQSPGLGATPTDVGVAAASPAASTSAEPCASVSPATSPTASLAPAGSPTASGVPCVPVASPAASAPVAVDQVLVGQVVQTRYGDIQVQITVNGTQITDVQALQLPHDRDYSAQISDYVEPYLRQMALQAQSAQIDVISGATYTSEGYAMSLQSALDQMATVQ
jgi:uncharacterized protein with FMN-binding domain